LIPPSTEARASIAAHAANADVRLNCVPGKVFSRSVVKGYGYFFWWNSHALSERAVEVQLLRAKARRRLFPDPDLVVLINIAAGGEDKGYFALGAGDAGSNPAACLARVV
jgi:hypothetical protein